MKSFNSDGEEIIPISIFHQLEWTPLIIEALILIEFKFNQKDDQDTNKRYIENVGNLFGWEKFAFGVGVGGEPWRWYPDEDHPGSAGEIILSDLLQGPNGQYIRGVRPCIICFTVETV